MPLKKAGKRAYKKKTYKKKTYKKSKVVRQLTTATLGRGFPQTMIMTHRYAQNDSLSNTSGATDYQTYSCNNLYDPDVSGGGHQPLNFDQAALIWNHYICIGSKITIRVAGLITGSAGSHTPCLFTLQRHSGSSPVYTDPTVVEEQNFAKSRINGPASTDVMTFTSTWSAKKVFGKGYLGNPNLQGTAAAAPAEQTYWTISNKPMDGLSSTGFQMNVIIDYICIWRELKSIVPS